MSRVSVTHQDFSLTGIRTCKMVWVGFFIVVLDHFGIWHMDTRIGFPVLVQSPLCPQQPLESTQSVVRKREDGVSQIPRDPTSSSGWSTCHLLAGLFQIASFYLVLNF